MDAGVKHLPCAYKVCLAKMIFTLANRNNSSTTLSLPFKINSLTNSSDSIREEQTHSKYYITYRITHHPRSLLYRDRRRGERRRERERHNHPPLKPPTHHKNPKTLTPPATINIHPPSLTPTSTVNTHPPSITPPTIYNPTHHHHYPTHHL